MEFYRVPLSVCHQLQTLRSIRGEFSILLGPKWERRDALIELSTPPPHSPPSRRRPHDQASGLAFSVWNQFASAD